MYENIVDDDLFNKDLLKLVVFCARKIASKKGASFVNFEDEGLSNILLGEIIERSEVKSYAKKVVRNTLL